jgi:hypothetical protein
VNLWTNPIQPAGEVVMSFPCNETHFKTQYHVPLKPIGLIRKRPASKTLFQICSASCFYNKFQNLRTGVTRCRDNHTSIPAKSAFKMIIFNGSQINRRQGLHRFNCF